MDALLASSASPPLHRQTQKWFSVAASLLARTWSDSRGPKPTSSWSPPRHTFRDQGIFAFFLLRRRRNKVCASHTTQRHSAGRLSQGGDKPLANFGLAQRTAGFKRERKRSPPSSNNLVPRTNQFRGRQCCAQGRQSCLRHAMARRYR